MRQVKFAITLLCLCCGVLGYFVGSISEKQDVIDSFGPLPECEQPAGLSRAVLPYWRKA